MNAACLFAGLGDALVWEHEGLKCIHGARERLGRQDPAVLSPPQAGQLAHLGNDTEHIVTDWEKQRLNPLAGLETLPRPSGTPTPEQTGDVPEPFPIR